MNPADLFPVAVFDARVTDGRQDGEVPLKLVCLVFKAFGHTARPKKIREGLGQFMHGPPHDVKLIRDFLSIQV